MQVTDLLTYRNGGIEFTVSGTEIDGRYGILHPNTPSVPVVRDGQKLPRWAPESAGIERFLDEWLRDQLSPDATAALTELDGLSEWRNLPDRLNAKESMLPAPRGGACQIPGDWPRGAGSIDSG